MWLYNVTLNPDLGGGGGVGGRLCLTCRSLQIVDETQTGVFPISRFLIIPLQTKIVITPELVMILRWNLDQ